MHAGNSSRHTNSLLCRRKCPEVVTIARINAAARQRGLPSSQFASGLRKAGIGLNCKMLAHLAVEDPQAFDAVLPKAQGALEN